MIALTYQRQAQEQQQDPGDAPEASSGNPADGPVPDGFGDDAIIQDLLGKPAPTDDGDGDGEEEPPQRKKPEVQEEEEPEDPVPDDDDPDDDDDALEVPDDPDEEDELEEAAEERGGKIAAARAALKAGDIDKAFMLAFGKKPEEVQPNNHVWTQWRAANDRAQKKQREERQAFEVEVAQARQGIHNDRIQIHHTIEALKPYEKYRIAEQAFEKEGDPQHLVDIVQGITKMPYNEAQKIILTKTRRSPTEVALQNKLAELERKLQETATEREKQQTQQTEAQQYEADLVYIRGQVSGVVTKLPKFAERIHRVLMKTRSPVGLTLTPQQAGEKVLAAERKRLANNPLVRAPGKAGKGKDGRVPAPVSDAARRLREQQQRRRNGSGPPLRRDSQNNGSKSRDKETDDDIIQDILGKGARRAG